MGLKYDLEKKITDDKDVTIDISKHLVGIQVRSQLWNRFAKLPKKTQTRFLSDRIDDGLYDLLVRNRDLLADYCSVEE